MKPNGLPFGAPKRVLAGQSGIIKSNKEKLHDAEMKIAQLERDMGKMIQTIETLKWHEAYFLTSVQALGTKLGVDAMGAKAIVDEFITQKELENLETQKAKFKADIAAGKPVQFQVLDRNGEQPGAGPSAN